jgi:hypothetical protein
MSTKNEVAEVKAEKEKKEIAHWDNANTLGLLQTMKEVTIDGKHADISFTTQEIPAITKKITAKFQLNYNSSQITSKICDLKKSFKEFERLRLNSGFGFVNNLPSAAPETWDE